MNKTELVDAMADELDMSKLQTTSVLQTIVETMSGALVRGYSFMLSVDLNTGSHTSIPLHYLALSELTVSLKSK